MEHLAIQQLAQSLTRLKVLVIGDLMLDCYQWGHVERISPEAPVPVVSIYKKESRLGGAANVALNCRALGGQVSLAGFIGKDPAGKQLLDLLDEAGISSGLVHHSEERPTASKTRIISRNQQMIRLDDEKSRDLSTREEHPFIDALLRYLQIHKPDLVILEDYNKGVLKENVISRVLEHCRDLSIVTAVDPKQKNFLAYKGVDIFKPNLKELQEGLGIALPDPESETELAAAHRTLQAHLQHRISLITLSEHGLFYAADEEARRLPGQRRNIADVSGAGDTVIATAAMIYTASRDAGLMAQAANIAGGQVCESVGVVPVEKDRLWRELGTLPGIRVPDTRL